MNAFPAAALKFPSSWSFNGSNPSYHSIQIDGTSRKHPWIIPIRKTIELSMINFVRYLVWRFGEKGMENSIDGYNINFFLLDFQIIPYSRVLICRYLMVYRKNRHLELIRNNNKLYNNNAHNTYKSMEIILIEYIWWRHKNRKQSNNTDVTFIINFLRKRSFWRDTVLQYH